MVHLAPNKKQIESGELRKRRLVIRAGLYNTPKTRARLLYYSVSPVYAAGGDRPNGGSGRTTRLEAGPIAAGGKPLSVFIHGARGLTCKFIHVPVWRTAINNNRNLQANFF